MNAILDVLSHSSEPCTTASINDEVASLLNLPEELLLEEDAIVPEAHTSVKYVDAN